VTDTPDTPTEDTPDPGDQPDGKTNRTRNGKGRFDRNPDVAARRAEAARLRARSYTYREIAAALDIPVSVAHEDVQEAMREVLAEPAEAARKLELEKLDAAERRVREVLERRHLTVSHGRVITQDGEPVEDDGPAMQAATTLVRISESRRKLLGLDAPAQVVTDSTVKYEIVGVDPADLA
jgi:hypothetical protein